MDTSKTAEKCDTGQKTGSSNESESSDEEEETTFEQIKEKFDKLNRLGKCEVCNVTDARYTCPKCELKTCSIPCVRIHKKELNCDGNRDRTKYIALRSMTNMDFMSDYYFLEECTRYVEQRKTDSVKRFTRYNRKLPTHLFRLRSAAFMRGTKLHILLQNFSRHKQNTTYFDWNQQRIYWRVEWIFKNAGERKYVDKRCSEDVPLWKLLEKYLNTEEAILQKVPEYKELEYYQSKGAFGIKILLKAEHIKHSQKRFYELDANKTLKDNLKRKTLVEYPTICLFSESHLDDLDIVDSDEDVEAETKAYLDSLDEVRRKEITAKFEAKKAEFEADEEVRTKKEEQPIEEPVRKKRRKVDKETQNYFFNNSDEFSSSSEELNS